MIDWLLICASTDRNGVLHAGANNFDPVHHLFTERNRFAFGFGCSLEVSDLYAHEGRWNGGHHGRSDRRRAVPLRLVEGFLFWVKRVSLPRDGVVDRSAGRYRAVGGICGYEQ